MDVNQVYEIIKYACAKNQQGYVSPEDFYVVINKAQALYLDYLLGEYQKYQASRPIPVVALGESQKIRESIAPLIYNTILSPSVSTGIAAFPSDYESVDAMWTLYNFYNIRFAQQDRFSAWYRSAIDPVETNPVYLIKHEGFHFYPENIGSARLSYVRTPPSIVWGYNLDSNGIPVYNPATSQQPVWPDFDMMNIITRALQIIGVALQSGVVMQYAQEVKTIGQ
jgi:hypothetical protein